MNATKFVPAHEIGDPAYFSGYTMYRGIVVEKVRQNVKPGSLDPQYLYVTVFGKACASMWEAMQYIDQTAYGVK